MVLVGSTVETLQFSKGSREDSARFSCASREFLSRSSWRPFSKAVKCRILMSTTSRFPFIRSELAFTAAQREPAVSLLVCRHSLHGKMSELRLDFHSRVVLHCLKYVQCSLSVSEFIIISISPPNHLCCLH